MKKIFSLLFLLAGITSIVTGQSIATISIDGTLAPASRRTTTPGEIQAVVAPDFDLSNVVIHYTLEDGCELASPMPSDFSSINPQTVTVRKTADQTTKNWAITIKKITPAELPFEQAFSSSNPTDSWSSSTVGWAASGIDPNNSSVARFGTAPVSFVVAFNIAPASVSYELFMVGTSNFSGEFMVEESADGQEWTTIQAYSSTNPMNKQANKETETKELKSTSRFIRWVYTLRSGINVNLAKFSVAAANSSIKNQQPEADLLYQTVPGEVFFNKEIQRVDVYSLLGTTIHSDLNENRLLFSDGTKGIAVLRIVLNDGSVASYKVTK